MQNRRLIILFVTFFLGFCALAARLTYLQAVQKNDWREVIRNFAHRTRPLETYRGAILDRNGQPLARDVPSDELAIDYRAMNLDEEWLRAKARERLRATGEWASLPNRAARERRVNETMDDLADQIDRIPDVIAQVFQMPKEDVWARYAEIRARIHTLRQDLWYKKFDRTANRTAGAGSGPSSTGDTDGEAVDAAFRDTALQEEFSAHTIRSNLSPAAATYFRQHANDYPGLIVRDKANRREYPLGEAAAHITGTLRSVTAQVLKDSTFKYPEFAAGGAAGEAAAEMAATGGNLRGYLAGDRVGDDGAERLLEPLLRGTRGVRLVDLSGAGDGAEVDAVRIDPEAGKDIRLTIDAGVQADLYNALKDPDKRLLRGDDRKDHFAALVVLSLDGQILALVSFPSYNPNMIEDIRPLLIKDTWRTPLLSRATGGVYQPGSTVKPLLAAAGLAERVITPDMSVLCTGHFYPNRTDIYKCLETHGNVELVRAISESCNVYFYTVGQRLGLDRLNQWYGAYGFGRDSGMELPEARGTIPKRAAEYDTDVAPSLALFAGIGQGQVAVTPLQMANAYATLLRGGVFVSPRILADTPVQQARAFTLSPELLATVRQGMEQVVASGTARSSFSGFRLPVAGKTGTAETGYRPVFDDDGNPVEDPSKPVLNPDRTPKLKPDGTPEYRQLTKEGTDAWFVGYAPADNPKFVVAAVMEWGGHGGKAAAPMVKEAFLQLQKHNYLPRVDVP
jgi:penicillin-binding protein 2